MIFCFSVTDKEEKLKVVLVALCWRKMFEIEYIDIKQEPVSCILCEWLFCILCLLN